MPVPATSGTTSGLVAYLDGEPVGWCETDDSVWAVTCFVTRSGFRRRGSSRAFARKAVDFARDRDARALEGYPMIDEPAQGWLLGELHVGGASSPTTEVSRPTVRRVVMRIDF